MVFRNEKSKSPQNNDEMAYFTPFIWDNLFRYYNNKKTAPRFAP